MWLRKNHMSSDTVWILLQYNNIDRGKEGSEKEVGKCQAAKLAFCHLNMVLPISSINVQTSKAADTCTVTQEPRPHRMCSPTQNPLIKGGYLQIASEVTCMDLFHNLHILT